MRLVSASEPIRHRYFTWLYDQVVEVRDTDSPLSYLYVCDAIHGIKFNDSVPNDSNRTAGGEELRDEFVSLLDNIGVEEYAEMESLGKASLFEVLVSLARLAYGVTEDGAGLTVKDWFHLFLENLGLLKYSDSRFVPRDAFKIKKILDKLNTRTYDPNGRGGLFPLKRTREDQRQRELWFQMSAYMTENEMY